jgi:hypothetical protein
MLDANGRLIRLGDRVAIRGGIDGVVVFSLDTGEFSPDFPKNDWSYLGRGIMIQTKQAGLIHLEKSDEQTEVVNQNSN